MQEWLNPQVLKAVEQGILGLMVALGVATWVVFVWRSIAIEKARRLAQGWSRKLESALVLEGQPDWSNSDSKGKNQSKSNKSPSSETGAAQRVASIALDHSDLCPEALEKLIDTQIIRERQRLERGAAFLGTVGSNAPFLGLTGTVLGILGAFHHMANTGGGGTEVMGAIAGALIATAAGLLVAIPAVVLYNILKARLRLLLEALGEIRSLLMARSYEATVRGPLG
jgi:biopolymer transport protein ExbB/TolQ